MANVANKAKRSKAEKLIESAKVLVLRTCNADMTSHNGFIWPKSGPVKCDDWSPEPICGNGLHGLLWGEGNGSLLNWSADAVWLIVEVALDSIVDLSGKVKYPEANVVYCGNRFGATKYLAKNGAAGKAIAGGTATAGDNGLIAVQYYCGKTKRWRLAAGYIGKAGIKANTPYTVDKNGKLIEKTKK